MKGLFRLAAAQVSGLTPPVLATLRAQEGNITQPDGTVVPQYVEVLLPIMVQPAPSEDLAQVAGLNQSTDTRVVYLPAELKGIDRAHQFGGDLLMFEGSEWLVTGQPETWGGGQWSKLLVTRQCPPACPL
ncbi:hypothetical protein [Acetobacter orleanensis]|uniref:Uncharacterized protein n=1 Tax=Acetobacter orleanensis TaxID=104099 RepID=A0A4Y3TGW1_9PROT|nr:hypothetical protein [Acetobacter orleanensis]KXV63952.1 hypothetical protein AD949_06535 [Acetobacter orleanensis]PCD79725.1 hypothetical protein CO710_05855 [Acetobacter orleanensis]GAN69293.1 hypothetical protein Abol_030_058 [Acetobacter orleanensis JCM 7639]GBR28308.1 hypothetical protein AA0473_1707 [Acetobacter orleanensis NRIC 0473]GEB82181.1 hypothetical protein AOR01nite_06580 [Acetobacter orleanensis]